MGPLNSPVSFSSEQLLDCFTLDMVRKPSSSDQLSGRFLRDLLSQIQQSLAHHWTVGSGTTSEYVCGQEQISFV